MIFTTCVKVHAQRQPRALDKWQYDQALQPTQVIFRTVGASVSSNPYLGLLN